MSTPDQRRSAIRARHPKWIEQTIPAHFDRIAADYPDRPFVLTDDRTYTYADMTAWSKRLARGLMANGLQRGEHVAVVLANYPELVALRLGIGRVGGVCVPVNTTLKRDEMNYIIRQSDAALLICMDHFRDMDYLPMIDALRSANGPRDALREVVIFSPSGQAPPPGMTSLESLEQIAERVSEAELEARQASVSPHNLVDIVYTSGTTGLPKGVMLSHDNVLRCSFSACLARAMEDGRRLLFSLPLYHNYAYIEGMLAMSWVAGAIVPQVRFDALDTLRAIERFRVNEPLFVPTMTIALLEHPQGAEFDLSSLTAVMSAAAPAPVTLWQRICDFFGVSEVTTAYGQTELASSACYKRPEDPLELLTTTVGRLKPRSVAGTPETDGRVAVYKVIDPVTLQDLPPGEPGEFVARGPERMKGYYNKPEETEAVLLPDGWMRTGDLGYIREDGNFALTGRSKELYKCGGELVSPKEIEDVLGERSDVSQVHVVGLPDERMGEVGCAIIVPAPGAELTVAEIDAYCRARLARFKVPRHVVFVSSDQLPTTATGKVQKFRLCELASVLAKTTGDEPASASAG